MGMRTNDLKRDRELGVNREITRRDFLNGVAIGVGGTLIGGGSGTETLIAAAALDEFAPEKAPDYFPPARMGKRGNHDGTLAIESPCEYSSVDKDLLIELGIDTQRLHPSYDPHLHSTPRTAASFHQH